MQKIFAIMMAAVMVFTTACAERSTTTTQTAQSGPVVAQNAAPGEIPSGTELAIRTNENIDVKTADSSGRTYSGEITREVQDSAGRILIPRGSPATLMVVSSNEGGTTGTDSLELALRSVTINGQSYQVSSGTVEQRGKEGLGGNQRTATMVGGGAVLGTLIGAVAGGTKGAVVGAVAGAAAGAGAQVLTRGKEVNVPAESVLTFRLGNPINLYRQ
jgi:hypothetical protein